MPYSFANNFIMFAEKKEITLFDRRTYGIKKITLDEAVADIYIKPESETCALGYILTVSGKLYTFASNDLRGFGGLSFGYSVVKNSSFSDIKLHLVDESIEKITQIKGGRFHTAVLNERGEVYVSSNTRLLEKMDLAPSESVKCLACEEAATLVVTQKDQLIRFSSNLFINRHLNYIQKNECSPFMEYFLGNLGDMQKIKKSAPIVLPKGAHPILNIFCVGETIYIITPDQVYATGSFSNVESPKEFRPIPQLANKSIINIVGGDNFRIVQTKENKLLGWGMLPAVDLGKMPVDFLGVIPLHAMVFATEPIMLTSQATVMRCSKNELLILTPDFQLKFFRWNEENIEQISLPTKLQSRLNPVVIEDYLNSDKRPMSSHLYRMFKHQQLTDISLSSSEEQNLTC